MRNNKRIDNKKTSRLLREAFRTRGMRQAKLSSCIGLNQSQISRLLNGQFQRPSKGLNALCAFLNVRPAACGKVMFLSGYPDLATCLSEVLDGSRKREQAVVRLLKSARKLA